MIKYKKMDGLFEIAGKKYVFDLNELSDFVRIGDDETVDDILNSVEIPKEDDVNQEIPNEDLYNGQMIDVTKWEITRGLIEVVLSENSIVDEKMGVTKLGEQLSIPFRLSFNTLYINKIIKENDRK
jgi:hypothetical protein